MDNFFDKYGRDRILIDWLKRYKSEYVRLYDGILARRHQYMDFNELIILAFEAGIDFSRATKRNARIEEPSPTVIMEDQNE
jgi:hypothetical protein